MSKFVKCETKIQGEILSWEIWCIMWKLNIYMKRKWQQGNFIHHLFNHVNYFIMSILIQASKHKKIHTNENTWHFELVLIKWCLLTHWGQVTHICISKLTAIASDNGLSPGRRQAIIWTNAGILLIGPLGTKFNEFFLSKFIHFHSRKSIWKCQENGVHFVSASMC